MPKQKENGIGVLDLTIEIGNIGQLNNLIETISDLEDVTSIYRLEPGRKDKIQIKKRNDFKPCRLIEVTAFML